MDSADAKVGEDVDIDDSETKDTEQELCHLNSADSNFCVDREVDVQKSLKCNQSAISSPTSSSGGVASRVLTPPDGGWGWVVVFASFMIGLIADGISLSFGILFIDLVDYFGESKAKTSWVGSVFFSMPLLAGPIASYLSDRYGCRKVCIAGAVLAAGAFVLSVFATSLEVLFVTFTIAGLGLALCYVTSVVIVAYYFEKKRSLATGISTCGTGVGTFIFPPFTMYLLNEYTWSGTLLILAGFFLNIVVFGALMRDIEPCPSESKSSVSHSGSGSGNETAEESERLCSSLLQLPTYLEDDMPFEVFTEISNKEGGYLSSLLQQHPYLLNSISKKKCLKDSSSTHKFVSGSKKKSKLVRESPASKADEKQGHSHQNTSTVKLDAGFLHNMRFQRGSITYRGAMLNIKRYRLRASSCPNIYRNSMTVISDEKMCACFKDMKELLLDMFDLSMFKNLQYTLFCVSNFLLYCCVDVPYVYIPDHASNLNINESASFLISVLGVLNTLGVVIVGYVGDKPQFDSSLLYSVFITLSGLVLSIIPFVSDYYGLAAICGIYGFTISANYTLIPIIIVNLISLDSFTGAYGLLLLVQGVASLIGPPLAGMVFDLTGNYDVMFLSTGIVIFISGIMVAVIPASKLFKPAIMSTISGSKVSVEDSNGATDIGAPEIILYNNHKKMCKMYAISKSCDHAKDDEISVSVPFLSSPNNNVKNSDGDVCKSKGDKISLYENPLSSV